jgi:hypothetical protein
MLADTIGALGGGLVVAYLAFIAVVVLDLAVVVTRRAWRDWQRDRQQRARGFPVILRGQDKR